MDGKSHGPLHRDQATASAKSKMSPPALPETRSSGLGGAAPASTREKSCALRQLLRRAKPNNRYTRAGCRTAGLRSDDGRPGFAPTWRRRRFSLVLYGSARHPRQPPEQRQCRFRCAAANGLQVRRRISGTPGPRPWECWRAVKGQRGAQSAIRRHARHVLHPSRHRPSTALQSARSPSARAR